MTQVTEITFCEALLARVIPDFADQFRTQIISQEKNNNVFEISTDGSTVLLKGDCTGSVATALGYYLKHICGVNQSWNGNRAVRMEAVQLSFDPVRQVIPQTYRVYMNYCTLAYSMCWWDWARWEKELDFMAMNGINMPLCVIGTEAVWFETLLELGFDEKESLSTISSPAFWPWQLMTNIEGYEPIHTKQSVYDRLELGKKILNRALEYGMHPIQQGFSGHVPVKLMEKYPRARIKTKRPWCAFPKTAQLDPLDPLFERFGRIYLEKQGQLMGNYHYYGCDPFHEGSPPKNNLFYLHKVGKAIDRLYKEYDKDSIWVMQSWSIRKHIATAVPPERLLILDLDGARCEKTRHFWGRQYVSCHLHNFGGKNSLHGKLQKVASNRCQILRNSGGKVVGAGVMMEGIEQNPVYYDLVFDVNLRGEAIDLEHWLTDYAMRRYGGGQDDNARQAWKLLLESCYNGQESYEEESGSVVCARPGVEVKHGAPNDTIGLRYDNNMLVRAVRLLLQSSGSLGGSDGYQFDLCDFTRQALSNLVVQNHTRLKQAVDSQDAAAAEALGRRQLELMEDLDRLLSHRSELCLDKWLFDAQSLARTEEEKRLFQRSAKLLVTIWGDANNDPSLYDYAWREWSGLISGYYRVRWQKFYDALGASMQKGTGWQDGKNSMFNRPSVFGNDFGKALYQWEKDWVNTYTPVEKEPVDTDVIPCVTELMTKYFPAE